ncbi:MAG: hypothetical protein O7D91_12740 [Planctomycetota bacterium]|nr:hypothetical protein [Planctomycetota bacterium]
MLLNIVRLRYNDSPMFLNVGDIDARFTLETSSSASGTIKENVGAAPLNANSAEISASSKFIDNPNIKLRPMQDADFARLSKPLTSQELLNLVKRRQSLYAYLALAMHSFKLDGKIVDAYKDLPAYRKLLKQLKSADETNTLRIITEEGKDTLLPPFRGSSINPEDVIAAKTAGWEFEKMQTQPGEKRDVMYHLARTTSSVLLEIPVEGDSDTQLKVQILPAGLGARDKLEVPQSRSIMEMIEILSRNVVVPTLHEPEVEKTTLKKVIPEFTILSRRCLAAPSNSFVSIKYRGYWFYIERTNTVSKKFFSVLTELFVERAGKAATTATTLAL